jgi:glycosyltransferase involved in cell wall biosynthesis
VRVAAFTASKTYASARFRVRQHVPLLKSLGVDVREFIAPIYKHWDPGIDNHHFLPLIRYARPLALLPSVMASHLHSVSWIQREFIWSRDTLERFTARPRIFDVDDAIWLERPGAAENIARLAERMDVIVAGNRIIAEWFGKHAHDVRIVHTAIDTSRFTPGEPKPGAPYTLVWTGQEVTLRHLYTIEDALARFLSLHPRADLVVVADARPRFRRLAADRVRFVPWSEQTEVEALRGAQIGIMPLIEDEHSRAKCSFKMLQYMACGLPVVVTPIGLNADILQMGNVGLGASTPDEWLRAFERIHDDPATAQAMGTEGRRIASAHFGHRVICARLASIFKDVVDAAPAAETKVVAS